MKYCYYCGTELNDDDAFCMNCGRSQDFEAESDTNQTEHKDYHRDRCIDNDKTSHNRNAKTIATAGVIALSVCALVIVGWFMMFNHNDSGDDYAGDYGQSYNDENHSYEGNVNNTYDFSAGKGVFAEASSELEESGNLTYIAHNAIDGVTSTAWVEGVQGDGIGESISITFDNDENEIDAICVRNGYDQIVFFDSPHWGKSITFTIESVYPGSRYSDTCISEIFLARGDWAYSSTTTMIYAELLY